MRTNNSARRKGRLKKSDLAGERAAKRAGGKLGDQFREKLKSLIAIEGSQRALARKLRHGDASDTDYSPRVGEWLRGKNLPGFNNLQRIAQVCDVSVDWLVGFDVGRRRTDREPIGDLSRALLEHVVRFYEARADGRRRDGLANALGGKLQENEPVPAEARKRMADSGFDWPSPGDVLPDGRIVTNRGVFGLQLLEVDPQALLERISEGIVEAAETWEQENQEAERQRVREDILRLLPFAAEIASAVEAMTGTVMTKADVLGQLLHAALNPLEPNSLTDVLLFQNHLGAFRRRSQTWSSLETEIVADIIAQIGRADEESHSLDSGE